jgi:hypothetical protein
MPTFLPTKSLWMNDVVLIAQIGSVESRENIPRELHRIIVAPMTAVVGSTFAKAATDLGLSVTIPRYFGIDKESEIYQSCKNKKNLFCSIGLGDIDRIKAFSKIGCTNFLIDVASGYLPQLGDTIKLLIDNATVSQLILGNVHSKTGLYYLHKTLRQYDPDGEIKLIVRCGIANGSGCLTSDQTGYNRGQITEIVECFDSLMVCKNTSIASDGGLKNGGYISKAFLAGADYAFVGGLFAKSFEAETHIIGDGTYWGLASHKNQLLTKGKITKHSEGKVYTIDKHELEFLSTIVDELWGCISSAVSYSGYDSLTESIGNGVFEIKYNSLPPKNR